MKKEKNDTKNSNDSGKTKCKFSHFNLESRQQLEELLNCNANLQTISLTLNKSQSSISREIKRNRKRVLNRRRPNHCIFVPECTIKHICNNMCCSTYCKNCTYDKSCFLICKKYVEKICPRFKRFPYVCNGCKSKQGCVLNFYNYDAKEAEATSRIIASECRRGINLTDDEFKMLDSILVKGTKKGQSVEHICSYGNFPVGSRTVRNYIDKGYTTTSKIETPRGLKYKKRKTNIDKFEIKKIRACKIDRDYSSFVRYMTQSPFCIYTELDTVEGAKGDQKKPLLLTLLIVKLSIFLCFLIPDASSIRKKEVFDNLYTKLGTNYSRFFSVILTDYAEEKTMPKIFIRIV